MSGYNMSAEIIGAKELAEAFLKAGDVTERELKNAVGQAMYDVANAASNTAPHLTGTLQASITQGTAGPFVTTNNVIATVGTNVIYAPYQEYGMRADGSHVVQHYSMPGTGKFFFKNAIEKVKPKFDEYMQRAVAAILNALKG